MSEQKPTSAESAVAWEDYAHKLEGRILALETQPAAPPRWFENAKVVGVIGELSAFLTLLSALPYELGDAANILPPNIKTYVASIGVFATLALRLWKRFLEPKASTATS